MYTLWLEMYTLWPWIWNITLDQQQKVKKPPAASLEQKQVGKKKEAVKAHVVSGKSPCCPYSQGFKHHGINMLNSHSSNWGPLSEFNTRCTLGCRGWIVKQMLCLYNYKHGECFRDPRTMERLCSEESGNSTVLQSDTMPKIFLISADHSTKFGRILGKWLSDAKIIRVSSSKQL